MGLLAKYHERSEELEYLDQGMPSYSLDEYRDCLKKLGAIGRATGGDHATLQAIRKLASPPTTILDVGCGGGDFALRMAKKYPQAHIMGIDLDRYAIGYACHQLEESELDNVTFETRCASELLETSKSFDVVTSTLVCHHMDDAQIVSFLQNAVRIARQAVIINDLHRHPLASLAFGLIAPWRYRNRLIVHDGLLSIKRAFTRRDWEIYLNAAGLPPSSYKIEWHWAFRWTITITPQ